ncbi:MAG: hypothetical protein P1U53_15330 [Sulfitobacter sp.]|nr:hypothetical protein [Sulfitobacter sp.]
MRSLALILLLLPAPMVLAEETWQPLSGTEIADLLTGSRVDYGDNWQEFRASGRTLYVAGAESWGYWAVRDDQYCSQWPPSDLWACYDMTRSGQRVQFIGPSGDVTVGVLRD